MERDALYWRYFYKFQSLLARDVNYMEQIESCNPGVGNGVRVESSLPFKLIEDAHEMAKIQRGSIVGASQFCLAKWATLRSHKWIEEVKIAEDNKLSITKVHSVVYHEQLNNLPTSKRVYLDDIVEADNYYLVVNKSNKVVGGFATTKRGYLTGVFTLIKGIGKDMYRLRLQQARKDLGFGVRQFRIFCTGEFLREFYEGMGFSVTDVVEWDDNYAPNHWDYNEKGRPNLYNMEKSVLF